jgi:hypothetical protein
MYCIAHRRVLPNLPEKERQLLLTQAHLHTLVEMLEAITDPAANMACVTISRFCSRV